MPSLRCFELLILCSIGGVTGFAAENSPSFRSDVAPILQENCVACHNAKKAEGGYRLDSFAELQKAGDSDETPVTAGDIAASELLRRVASTDESERMPAETQPLSPEQIETVKQWIVAGGKFDGVDPAELLPFVIPPAQYPDPPESYPRAVPVTAIAFTPDGQQLVAAGYYEVTIWNMDGKLVRRIGNLGQQSFAIEFSDDGKTLVVGCGQPGVNGEVRLVDFESGKVRGVAARTTDVVLDVTFRPGTSELAVASADNRIRFIDVATLEVKRTIASHADWVTSVAFNHDGTRLASASRDKSSKLFDATTGQLLVSYQGHASTVRSVGFLPPSGAELVSVGEDKKLHRWAAEKAAKSAEVALGGGGYQLSISPTDVFVPVTDGRLLKIAIADNKLAGEYKGHSDWVLSSAIDRAHQKIAAGAYDGKVHVWNVDGSPIGGWLAKP